MVKKKSKNKRKKLDKQRDSGSGKGALGANLRQAGTVAAAAIVGEIVEATIEKLIHKTSQAKSKISDSNGADQHSRHRNSGHQKGTLEAATSKLQDGVQDAKPAVREAGETVKDSLSQIRPTLADVADSLREAAQDTLQRSLAIAAPAEITVESAVDTAKNVIGAISQTGSKKSDKKSKKNKKKA